jgi:hypothetical protein
MTKMLGERGYSLVMTDGTRTEFRARDAAHALTRAQDILPRGCSAALCEDGVPLAEISFSPEGYWSVSKPDSASARC